MMTAENCCVSAEENVGFSGIFPGRFFLIFFFFLIPQSSTK